MVFCILKGKKYINFILLLFIVCGDGWMDGWVDGWLIARSFGIGLI